MPLDTRRAVFFRPFAFHFSSDSSLLYPAPTIFSVDSAMVIPFRSAYSTIRSSISMLTLKRTVFMAASAPECSKHDAKIAGFPCPFTVT
jgi:hypothetical protein